MFRRKGSHCVATFAVDEVRVLRKVAGEVVALLTDGMDHGDPVVSRLFPDIYPDRPEESQEFRLYTEGDLMTGKIDQAGAILAALPSSGGGDVALDAESAEAWLRGLTDVRLAIGTAWLVIVAAEMLTGGVGIGFWVWDEWNNLNVTHIIIAIFAIGIVGLLLEQALIALARAVSFGHDIT